MKYYASPTGTGDGTFADPFKIANFWLLNGGSGPTPGDFLYLLPGRYTEVSGNNGIIAPPENTAGTAENPITIKAWKDGTVELDGADTAMMAVIYLRYNDYFIIEGFNAHLTSSRYTTRYVVRVNYSNYNIFRKICAWDADDANTPVFGHYISSYILYEDCAGWGIGKKIFDMYYTNYITVRRCFFMFEGSHNVGVQMACMEAYETYNATTENCICTWDATRQMKEYQVFMNGVPWPIFYYNYETPNPYGIMAVDRNTAAGTSAYSKVLGTIVYLLSDQKYNWDTEAAVASLIENRRISDFEYFNCISYSEVPQRALYLRVPFLGGGVNVSAHNMTSISPTANIIGANWDTSNIYYSTNSDEMIAENGNLLGTIDGEGATIQKRYIDRDLTFDHLWPWPMNKRILDAMTLAGRDPVINVNKVIMGLGK